MNRKSPDIRVSSCPTCGKWQYLTRADAKRAAKQQNARFRTYQCGVFWHLTSWQPPGKVAFYRRKERRST